MSTIIWRIRFAVRLRKLLSLPWRDCWDYSASWLEINHHDLSESPTECAEAEFEEWCANAEYPTD